MQPNTSAVADLKSNDKKNIVLSNLDDLDNAIQKGDLDRVINRIDFLHENFVWIKKLLPTLYKSGKCKTQNDLIITACIHKQSNILDYLLNETYILSYLIDEDFDDNKVDKQRVAALRYAICSDDFPMIEMLYDYWCRDSHNDAAFVLNNIKRLGCLLNEVRTTCENYLIPKQQMYVNVHCLIKFNAFQQELHTVINEKQLNNVKIVDKAKAVGIMILNVLRIYNKYSDLDTVRIPHSIHEHEQSLKAQFEDKSSVYMKWKANITYEVYFRKLDFNVSLIILEQLNFLRNHLKKRFNVNKHTKSNKGHKNNTTLKINPGFAHASRFYEKIECTLYHFIYRIIDDWRLYLPGNRQLSIKKNRIGFHGGQIYYNLELKYDENKNFNGPVIYLERRNFKKYLNKLKKILNKYVIKKEQANAMQTQLVFQNAVQNGQQDLLDDNYLKPMKYMRDYYSLKKIVYYVKAIENDNEPNVLMIERVLQVVGEMLKSTKDSHHLTRSVKALVQTEISVETVQHLHNIRDYLSHADKSQVSTRIEVAKNHKATFVKVQTDLKKMLGCLNPIIEIYKLLLDKSLLVNGIDLLDERIKKLPDEAQSHIDYINKERKSNEFEENYMQNIWIHTGLTRQLLREIICIQNNMEILLLKRDLINTFIRDLAVTILPKYIIKIKSMLEVITENKKEIGLINIELSRYKVKQLPDNPRIINIIDISGKLEKRMKNNKNIDQVLLLRINKIKDLSNHWHSIQDVITFFRDEINCKVKHQMMNTMPDIQADTIHKILGTMESWCLNMKSSVAQSNTCIDSQEIYDGIEALDNNIYTVYKCDTTEESLRTKRDQLITCLINRIDFLKDTLLYTKQISLSQLLLKYKCDHKFQLTVEILLVDIANILVECNIRLMNKPAKLLMGIDLGNVLDHGNPFIEVIGDVLDTHDFSTALLSKAIMFAKDREAIAALHKLFQDKIKYEAIEHDHRHLMNDDQITRLDIFKLSGRWESYLKLIPK